MRLGVLTGGGDCPGLNAAIRAVTRKSIEDYGSSVLGIKRGWLGLLEMEDGLEPLDIGRISGILRRGGTILATSRTNPFKMEDGPNRIKESIDMARLDAVVAIGGEDTWGRGAAFPAGD